MIPAALQTRHSQLRWRGTPDNAACWQGLRAAAVDEEQVGATVLEEGHFASSVRPCGFSAGAHSLREWGTVKNCVLHALDGTSILSGIVKL